MSTHLRIWRTEGGTMIETVGQFDFGTLSAVAVGSKVDIQLIPEGRYVIRGVPLSRLRDADDQPFDSAVEAAAYIAQANAPVLDRLLSYDLSGRLMGVETPLGTTTFTYSPAGLLIGVTGPGRDLTLTYTDGRLTSVTTN